MCRCVAFGIHDHCIAIILRVHKPDKFIYMNKNRIESLDRKYFNHNHVINAISLNQAVFPLVK